MGEKRIMNITIELTEEQYRYWYHPHIDRIMENDVIILDSGDEDPYLHTFKVLEATIGYREVKVL